MMLAEELARVKIAEVRAEADKLARQNQLKATPERVRPLRSFILRWIAAARAAATGSDERQGRMPRKASSGESLQHLP